MIELRSVAKNCENCKEVILPPRQKYFEGEVVTCKKCGTRYTVVSFGGLFALRNGYGMIAKGIRLLRYLETTVRRRTKFGTLETLYFDNEDLAERYALLYNQTGGNTSWYKESLLRGRSQEKDIIVDEMELYAVSI